MEIHGEYLRSKIGHNGCCGAWELLKLYSWNLTEYHRVVHVDMDAFLLQNIDELYDDDSELWGGDSVRALYTYDWTMAHRPWGINPPVQGGFFVAKPDPGTYEAMVDVIRQGDYRAGKGWGGTGAGTYYGGMTIQGLLPYFFERLRPGTGRAVDNCVYNNMANNPRTVDGFGKGDCRDGTKPPATCNDCRLVDVATVKSVHMTICGKPWSCSSAERLSCPYCPICAKFHKRWFDLRKELEVEWGTYDVVRYTGRALERQGMCYRRTKESSGYKPIPIELLLSNSSLGSAWRASWRRQ